MIGEDVALAGRVHKVASAHPELEAFTHNLSITTLRYVPPDLRARVGSEQTEAYLNRLNQLLLTHIENSGEVFCSNALIEGKYALRFCIVNFRTTPADLDALLAEAAALGRSLQGSS